MKHLFIFLFLLCFLSLHSCKEKKDNVDPTPQTNELVVGKFKAWYIVDQNTNAGLVMEDALSKETIFAYGKKDTDGNLIKLTNLLVRNKDADGTVLISLNSQDQISSIQVLSNKGKRTLNFYNYDLPNKKVSAEIVDLISNSVIVPRYTLELTDNMLRKMQLYQSLEPKGGRLAIERCSIVRKLRIIFGLTDCYFETYVKEFPNQTICSALRILLAEITCDHAMAGLYAISNCPSPEEEYQQECEDINKDSPPRHDAYCVNQAYEKFLISKNSEEFYREVDQCKSPVPQPGHSTGDPHLTTMDGIRFDFHGHGEFIACKSITDNFEVQVRQEDVGNTGYVTMNTAVSVKTENDVVCVTANPNRLFINNISQNLNFDLISLKNGAYVRKSKANSYDVIRVSTQNGDVVAIKFQGSYLLDYSIYLMKNRMGKIEGLMGDFDGNNSNDIKIRNGEVLSLQGGLSFNKLYPTYADSWRIQQNNSVFYYDSGKNSESYIKKDFPKSPVQITADRKLWAESVCRAAGVTTEPFLSNCITDVALTNDPTLAASSLWGQTIEKRTSTSNLPIINDPSSGIGTGTWVKKADFSGPYPDGVSTAFAIDNIIYVCGSGTTDNNSAWLGKASLYAYNPATNAWVKKAANLPATSNDYQAYGGVTSFVIGRKGYLVTGYTNSSGNVARRLWEYDPDKDAWTAKKNLPFDSNAQRFMPVAFSHNGKGYFGFNASIGGASHGRELWEYDPVADSWKLKTTMPQAAQVGLVTAHGLIDDKLYTLIVGSSSMFETSLYEYDFVQNSWSKKRSLSGFNMAHSGIGAVLNGQLYCGLTYTTDASRKFSNNNLFGYDPKNDSWTQVKDFPAVERSSKVGVVVNGKLYAGFGSNFISGQGSTYFSDWWEYTP